MLQKDGTIGYLRSPRRYPALPTETIQIEPPPQAPTVPTSSLLFLILPIIGSVLTITLSMIFMAGRSGSFYLISIPMMLLTTGGGIYKYVSDRKRHKQAVADRIESYQNYLSSMRSQIEFQIEQQGKALNDIQPPPRELVLWCKTVHTRLWERSPADADYLNIRVGTVFVPTTFQINVKEGSSSAFVQEPLLEHARILAGEFTRITGPVQISLAAESLAIVGPYGSGSMIGASLLAQVATHHSPEHVRVAVLATPKNESEWNWTRWLPHVWDSQRTIRTVATDSPGITKTIGEINSSINGINKQQWVVIITDAELVSRPELSGLLKTADSTPLVRLIVITEIPTLVPRVCKTILEMRYGQGAAGVVRVSGPPSVEFNAQFDTLSSADADILARGLAPLRLVSNSQYEQLIG